MTEVCARAIEGNEPLQVEFSSEAQGTIKHAGLSEIAERARQGLERITSLPRNMFDALGIYYQAALDLNPGMFRIPFRRLVNLARTIQNNPDILDHELKQTVELETPITETQRRKALALESNQLVLTEVDFADPNNFRNIQWQLAQALARGMPIILDPTEVANLPSLRQSLNEALKSIGMNSDVLHAVPARALTPWEAIEHLRDLNREAALESANYFEALVHKGLEQMRIAIKDSVLPYLQSVMNHRGLRKSQKRMLISEVFINMGMPREHILRFWRAQRARTKLLERKNLTPAEQAAAIQEVDGLTAYIIDLTLTATATLSSMCGTGLPARAFAQTVAEICGVTNQDTVENFLRCFEENGVYWATLHMASGVAKGCGGCLIGLTEQFVIKILGFPDPFTQPEECADFIRDRVIEFLLLRGLTRLNSFIISLGTGIPYGDLVYMFDRFAILQMLPNLVPILQKAGLNVEVLEELPAVGSFLAKIVGFMKYLGLDFIGIGPPTWRFSREGKMDFYVYESTRGTEAFLSAQPVLVFTENSSGWVELKPLDTFTPIAPMQFMRTRSRFKIAYGPVKIGIHNPSTYLPNLNIRGFKTDDAFQKGAIVRLTFRWLAGLGVDPKLDHRDAPGAINAVPWRFKFEHALVTLLTMWIPRFEVYPTDIQMRPIHRVVDTAGERKTMQKDLPHIIMDFYSSSIAIIAHILGFYVLTNGAPWVRHNDWITHIPVINNFVRVAIDPRVLQTLNPLIQKISDLLGSGGQGILGRMKQNMGASGDIPVGIRGTNQTIPNPLGGVTYVEKYFTPTKDSINWDILKRIGYIDPSKVLLTNVGTDAYIVIPDPAGTGKFILSNIVLPTPTPHP